MATFTGIKNILREFYNRISSVISNEVGEEAKARRFSTLSAVAGITNNNEINITVDGFTESDLVQRLSLKLLVTDVLTVGSPTISINGTTAKEIKATRAGSKVSLTTHTGYWEGASSTSARVWDANTSLDLIYDGTDWVIIGNPVLCSYFASDKSYSVYANGYIEQWGTYDKGSDQRSVFSTVIFPVLYSDVNSYAINIAGIRESDGNFVGNIGISKRLSYSVYIGWYGDSATDLSRYLSWEVMGY